MKVEQEKADTDIKREMQLASLRYDISQAKPLKEIVWQAIKSGTDPRYLAVRYNLPVEDLERAKAEHLRREELKRERHPDR